MLFNRVSIHAQRDNNNTAFKGKKGKGMVFDIALLNGGSGS